MKNNRRNRHACPAWTQIAGLAFALFTAAPGFAQGAEPPPDAWLERILASLQQLETQAQDQAARADRKILAAEQVIRQSTEAFAAAEAAANATARDTARQALARATAAEARARRLREAAEVNAHRARAAARSVRRLADTAREIQAKALLVFQKGDVRISSPQGARQTSDPSVARPLQSGDMLRTGPGGFAQLFLGDGQSTVMLGENTTASYRDSEERTVLDLVSGEVRLAVKKWTKRFEIPTPTAVCAVRGTRFAVRHDRETRNTELAVVEGMVEAWPLAADKPIEVPAGMRLLIRSDGAVGGPLALDPSAVDPWESGF